MHLEPLTKPVSASARKRWNPTKVQHLVRHESGTYYVRLKKNGKQTQRSLKTAHLEIARRRLVEALAEHKQRTASAGSHDGTASRFGEVSAIMLQSVNFDPSRKPRARRYWAGVPDAMWRTWPDTFTYTYVTDAPHLIANLTGPFHTAARTYEANRDVLASLTNTETVGTPGVISKFTYAVNNIGQRTSIVREGGAFGIGGSPMNDHHDRYTYNGSGEVVTADR